MLGNLRVDETSHGFSMGPMTSLDALAVVRNILLVWHLLHAYLSLCESGWTRRESGYSLMEPWQVAKTC